MGHAGAIIGMPFSLEGFAFFTEGIFLGIYLYGWKRVAPRAHLFAGVHGPRGRDHRHAVLARRLRVLHGRYFSRHLSLRLEARSAARSSVCGRSWATRARSSACRSRSKASRSSRKVFFSASISTAGSA